MRGSGKKGLLFLVGGSSGGRWEEEGFSSNSSSTRCGAFRPTVATTQGGGVFLQQQQRGVGFSDAGCGRGFLGVVWRCPDGQKMEPFPSGVGVGVGAGVPTGSWKDGVSSIGWVPMGKKGKLFFSSTGVLPTRDDNNGRKN